MAFYIATEIKNEYAASADQLSAKTFDEGDYTGGLDDRRQLQEPISDRLYLAGEAVGLNNPATVTGAVLSRHHAAGQLMHRLSG